jgi:hypothetical protein
VILDLEENCEGILKEVNFWLTMVYFVDSIYVFRVVHELKNKLSFLFALLIFAVDRNASKQAFGS